MRGVEDALRAALYICRDPIGNLKITPRVTLGVNNTTDKLYAVAGNSSLSTGSGYAEIAYARPREYFGLVSYVF